MRVSFLILPFVPSFTSLSGNNRLNTFFFSVFFSVYMYLINNVFKHAVLVDSNSLHSALTPLTPPIVANNHESIILEPIADQPSEITPTIAGLSMLGTPAIQMIGIPTTKVLLQLPNHLVHMIKSSRKGRESSGPRLVKLSVCVLEAAGLIVKSDKKPPPRPIRTRSHHRSRAPPVVSEKAARRESKGTPLCTRA